MIRNNYTVRDREFVFYAAGVLTAVAGLFMPAVLFSANRVVSASPVVMPSLMLGFMLASVLLACFFCFPYRRINVAYVFAVFSLLLMGLVPLFAVGYAKLSLSPAPPARINPGPGFFMFLVSAFFFSSSLFYRGRRSARSVLFSLLAVSFVLAFIAGWFSDTGLVREYESQGSSFFSALYAHLQLAFGSSFFAVLIGVPLAIVAYRKKALSGVIMSFAGGIQTVPSLALFGFLLPVFALLSSSFPVLREIGIRGIGAAPAFAALSLYALLPIVRNTLEGLRLVESSLLDAAKGMGLSKRQIFLWVELPVAMPIVLAGVRTSSVQAIGLATVAALIGAGSLGRFVFMGLAQSAYDLVMLGVLPIVLMAIITDRIWAALIALFYRR